MKKLIFIIVVVLFSACEKETIEPEKIEPVMYPFLICETKIDKS